MPPEVELTDERLDHIRRRHPDLLPGYLDELTETVEQPDSWKPDSYTQDKFNAWKWFANIRGGKFVIVHIWCGTGASLTETG